MKTNNLLTCLIDVDFDKFKIELNNCELTESELQSLSIEILVNFEFENNFKLLKQTFDLLFDKKLNPNLVLTDKYGYKTSLLCEVIKKHTSKQVFDYFISKCCNINLKINEEDCVFSILDFANEIIQDLIYESENSKFPIKSNYFTAENNFVLVDKTEYNNLVDVSNILHKIYKTSVLRDTIIAFGGKSAMN